MRIDTLLKSKCTGCSACLNVCPNQAIEMQSDNEGFLSPEINEQCIDCGLCAEICPSITKSPHLNQEPKCFAVWARSQYREQGSSGGVFACIAEHILNMNGTVYGAAFEKNFKKVHHIKVAEKSNLPRLYKSKYVQSEIGDVYSEIKEQLEIGKNVLFSGCPCQVDGLKSYLRQEYDNLYTIDIVCLGVPSPLAYNKFLEEVSQKREIESVDFRDKKYGWGSLLNITFGDGSIYYEHYDEKYFRAFHSGLFTREACFYCQYAQPLRVGDLTLGDFWGIDRYKKELNDGKGTSIVLCSSKKGLKLFNDISEKLDKKEEIPYETVINIAKKSNGALIRPAHKPEMRKCFLEHLEKGDSFSKSLRYAEKALMDIGILGWWIETPWSNYGSTLTCYALYRYLSDEGYSVTFVSPPDFDRKKAGKFNLENGYRMTMKRSMEEMSENNKYIDTFIVGSDVLWYYDAFIKIGYTFLLDFVNDSKKKIAYSTSFGNTARFFPKEEMEKARALMRRFDSIAVRELEAVDICRDRFGVHATLVLDPVFLCSNYSWQKLADKAVIRTEGKYLFAYMLDPTEKNANEIKIFAERMNLKVVSITDKQFKPDQKKEILNECGIIRNANVNDYIYHLMNAEYIVTDSYHGFCFSLVFRKQFAVLINRSRGGARFETLISLLGVSDRALEDISELSTNNRITEPVNYKKITPIIESETLRCKEWLKNAIEL
ncbi:MAG: polysaccharide pyruvyl transferase family protein [Lachnospiraceae bacterium]|nr:polysaccharide pyruvyl transferase family protein [Lachnospiraceae bacterium]MCM1238728.1 polysaccharide pyruvyl transferase family protein [Lachnospiraceae bacterium]